MHGDNGQKYYGSLSQPTIAEVRSIVYNSEFIINELLLEIEKNLDQVNINAYSSVDLENAHKAVWKDAVKHSDDAKSMKVPGYITFDEYRFANAHSCRSCRELIKQYDLTVNHTSYGHLFEIKKIISYVKNEITIIKNIVTHQFGERYLNEAEGEIAKQLSDWAKAATHYTKQVASEITTSPSSIPQSELDQISQKQAVQLQAFFSLKINSYTSEISSISNSIKRDCVDTASVFYNNYLLPAITFKSKVVEPLIFDFTTTNIRVECPTIFGEVVVANNSVTGNLGSVSTDFIERRNQMEKKMSAIIQLVVLKRRYVNYISQLESKAVKRKKLLVLDKDENLQKYKDIYNNIPIDSERRENLRSSHSQLDDLEEDSHPQYLRRDGGVITGKIEMADGATIAGINIADHNHSGTDGSNIISASSIDYQTARTQYYNSAVLTPYSNIKVSRFSESLLVGGGISFEATIEIDIDEDKLNTYEFEILYTEI